jgi:response regulator RpfG family c-di-GMP phosphodiesterase
MILEDDLVTSIILSKMLRSELPDVLTLTAYSIAEARLLLQEYFINCFILDVNLPDGSGIDFIFDIMSKNPSATVMIMTATPLPEYHDQAKAYDVVKFMAKPLNNRVVLSLVRDCRDANAVKAKGDTNFFAASLSRLTVLDIIQLKCLSRTTQVVDFATTHHGRGRVYFQNGEIIHAETATAKGELALSEIIGWRGGRAEEVLDAPVAERSIFTGWQTVLLNAAQAADEKQSA